LGGVERGVSGKGKILVPVAVQGRLKNPFRVFQAWKGEISFIQITQEPVTKPELAPSFPFIFFCDTEA
jgi:hypothetical protein